MINFGGLGLAGMSFTDQPALTQACFRNNPDEIRTLLYKKEDVNSLDSERRSPLHAAAFCGEGDIAELLILGGAKVNAKDSKWLTPLHRACCSRSEDVVDVLIRHQADANARDKNWQTPVHVGAAADAVKCLELLVPILNNVNVTDRAGRTALHHAAFNGHEGATEVLLNNGSAINAFDKKDRRALHYAAFMGHVEVVTKLVSAGAEINCRDKTMMTPLHAASASGHLSVIQHLLEVGADASAVDMEGNTPVHVACLNGQDVVLAAILSSSNVSTAALVNAMNKAGQTPLHFAAISTHGGKCLELLLQEEALVNAMALDGRTPLHLTAIHGRHARAEPLLEHGASIDAVDKDANTPLHIASLNGHELLIRTLLSHKAEPSRRGYSGMMPVHMSALNGYTECVKKFLTSETEIDVIDGRGRTPLHCAACSGNIACLDLLLSAGSDCNAADQDSRTCLHFASAHLQQECLMALLTAGAKVDETDIKGRTALHYASSADFDAERTKQVVEKCVETLLRQGGANASLRDYGGFHAVYFAAANGHKAALELLLDAASDDLLASNSGIVTPKISPLHLAAHNGHHEALVVLLNHDPVVDCRDDLGRTPLHLAAASGHKQCVKALLMNGATPHVRDNQTKMTPFHASASSGHVECLHLLLEAAAELNPTETCASKHRNNNNNDEDDDDHHRRKSKSSSINNNMEPVTMTRLGSCSSRKIQRGSVGNRDSFSPSSSTPGNFCSEDLDVIDSSGRTPLMLSSLRGYLDVVNFLLHHEADIHARDTRRRSALHYAAGVGHEEVVMALVTHAQSHPTASSSSPSANQRNNNSNHHHNNSRNDNLVLVARDALGRSPLHYAAMGGHSVVLIALMQSTGNGKEEHDLVTSRDVKSFTPLHWAAYFGHEAVLELLLENEKLRESWSDDIAIHFNGAGQADEGRSTTHISSNFSPIHCAAMRGHVTCVEILLETTPILLASSTSYTGNLNKRNATETGVDNVDDDDASMDEDNDASGVASEPLAVGELINGVKDPRGRTAMHVAAFYNHVPILQFLIGHEADVNGQDKDGLTPVMMAAANGQEAALDLLLDSGGDMSIRDCAGNTALHHACVQQQKTTALQLLDKASEGVQEKHLHSLVNSANEEQKTPLHIAGSAGLTEVVHVLLRKGASVTALDSKGAEDAKDKVDENMEEENEEKFEGECPDTTPMDDVGIESPAKEATMEGKISRTASIVRCITRTFASHRKNKLGAIKSSIIQLASKTEFPSHGSESAKLTKSKKRRERRKRLKKQNQVESCQALDAGPGESGASTGAEDAERGEVESQGQMSLVRLDDAAESAGVTQEVERKDAGMVSHDSVSESTLSRSALPLSVPDMNYHRGVEVEESEMDCSERDLGSSPTNSFKTKLRSLGDRGAAGGFFKKGKSRPKTTSHNVDVTSPLDDVGIVEVNLGADPLKQQLPPMLRRESRDAFPAAELALLGADEAETPFVSQQNYLLCQPLNQGSIAEVEGSLESSTDSSLIAQEEDVKNGHCNIS